MEKLWADMAIFLHGDDGASWNASISLDALSETVAEHCLFGLGVHVHVEQVRSHVLPFFTRVVSPTLFGSQTVCRSRLIMQELLGQGCT